jgi:hypothetical protein
MENTMTIENINSDNFKVHTNYGTWNVTLVGEYDEWNSWKIAPPHSNWGTCYSDTLSEVMPILNDKIEDLKREWKQVIEDMKDYC